MYLHVYLTRDQLVLPLTIPLLTYGWCVSSVVLSKS